MGEDGTTVFAEMSGAGLPCTGGRRAHWWGLGLAAGLLLGLLRPAGAQEPSPPLVLAFYYLWYDETTWTPARVPDIPLEPYVSRDPQAMARHIQQARSAGIDALLAAWYGPEGESNQTEPNLRTLLDQAAAANYRIGLLFETDSPFLPDLDATRRALVHAQTVHAAHPAYLRVQGRPVLFFWRVSRWPVDTWRQLRAEVDPSQGALWIAEGVDPAYLAVFDGLYLYSNTWNPPTDLDYTNRKFARLVAQAGERLGASKRWVATVMPGYDDTRTGRANAFVRDREGGAYYAASWQAAMASHPAWIVITSFNEWPEGTYIEPSQAYGRLYLDLTAEWAARFKAQASTPGQVRGASVAPVEDAAQAPAPTPAPTPTPTEPTAVVAVHLLNLRDGPSTVYPVRAIMGQGQALPVIGRPPLELPWWQVRYRGQPGWAYGPYLRLTGPVDRVPVAIPPGVDLRARLQSRLRPSPVAWLVAQLGGRAGDERARLRWGSGP